jgi:hypothetical protein
MLKAAHKIETLALNWSLAKQLGETGRKNGCKMNFQ